MARPRFEGKIYRYRLTLSLREGEHDDLIAIMEDAKKGELPQVVITRMRMGIGATAVDEIVDEEGAINSLFGMMK